MARTPYKMKGMSFKEGQTPLKNLTQEAFAAGEPGSSKNKILKMLLQKKVGLKMI